MRNITITAPATITRRAPRAATALRFEPLTPEAIPAIRRLLPLARTRANDFSIGGILMWADYFDYEYCIYGDTLFIKGVSELSRDIPAFSLPFGAMPLANAVDLIADYCRVNRLPVRFSAVPHDRLADLTALRPSAAVQPLDDWSDYIYNATDLATLAGKRYNKKRNHVNRFLAGNPGYRVEPITPDVLPEVRRVYGEWLAARPVDAPSAAAESVQTLNVIDNYADYGFDGIVLRDNAGRVVAFTMGEVIGDTLFTHIEKMDHTVAGAGETVNNMFAKYITGRYPAVAYINREEDAGDEGLRRAKLSYHPAIILSKYDVIV